MFGKLLLTVAVIAVIWFAFRHFARTGQARRRDGADRGARKASAPTSGPEIEAENMVECRVCGTWQPTRAAKPCGRADCPY